MKVVNCKKTPFDVYIGRPRKDAPWGFGNPFEMAEDGDRRTVCSKFYCWIKDGETFGNSRATEKRRQWIIDNLEQLRGKTLGCFCAPFECHGDMLIKLLE